MAFRAKKVYGKSKIERCPFCERTASLKNCQGLNVCSKHKDKILPDIKCLCGNWLELHTGKYGAYFHCIKCGNINYKRAREFKVEKKVDQNKELSKIKVDPQEMTVTSRDAQYFS